MKRIIVAMALVLMSAGTVMAHGGVNFQIGIGIPLSPYSYPTYSYPASYGYYYPAPYSSYYPPAPVVYGSDPFFSTVIVNRGFGHNHFVHRGVRFHNGHFGNAHFRRFGR